MLAPKHAHAHSRSQLYLDSDQKLHSPIDRLYVLSLAAHSHRGLPLNPVSYFQIEKTETMAVADNVRLKTVLCNVL